MENNFKKLMQEQLQEQFKQLSGASQVTKPKSGWIRVIRDALGMSGEALAKRLNCSQANVTALERRERTSKISLEALDQAAKVLNCKLVYFLIPNEPLNKILENRAKLIAKRKIDLVNHSMSLEQQGLTSKQLQQQERDLIEELLQGNPKNLWIDDKI